MSTGGSSTVPEFHRTETTDPRNQGVGENRSGSGVRIRASEKCSKTRVGIYSNRLVRSICRGVTGRIRSVRRIVSGDAGVHDGAGTGDIAFRAQAKCKLAPGLVAAEAETGSLRDCG
jgi:hypothetical protein